MNEPNSTPPGRLAEYLKGDLAPAIRHVISLQAQVGGVPAVLSEVAASLARCVRRIDRDLTNREPGTRIVTCVYCGHEYPPGRSFTDHLGACEKHPMHALRQQLDRLTELSVLAMAIAEDDPGWREALIQHPEYECPTVAAVKALRLKFDESTNRRI